MRRNFGRSAVLSVRNTSNLDEFWGSSAELLTALAQVLGMICNIARQNQDVIQKLCGMNAMNPGFIRR